MELNRIETTLAALTAGAGYEWSESYILAHGLSGQRNPLAYALDHLLDKQSSGNLWMATHLLSGELIRQKVCKSKDSVDLARDSLQYWLTKHCVMCHGTGVLNIEQDQCPMCGGTGKRYHPANYEGALKVIEGALEWMESQLQNRLR